MRVLLGFARWPLALVWVGGLDEAMSGLPFASSFALRADYAAGQSALNLALFVIPQAVSLLIEAPLLLWAERWPRHRAVAVGLLGMAVSLLGCALSPSLWVFCAAWCVFFPASGLCCGLAQAALMDADPEHREQRMADWAVAGWVGDLGGPWLLWLSVNMGLGWQGAMSGAAGLLVVAAGICSLRPLPQTGAEQEDEHDEELSLVSSLRLLLRQRLLFAWLFGVTLCSLLDELFATLVAVDLQERGGGIVDVTTSFSAFTLGGVVGLGLTRWVLSRLASSRVLVVSCAGAVLCHGLWLLSQGGVVALVWMFLSGLFVAMHYPLAQARAYEALPGRSTLVAAAGQAFTGIELLFPLAFGAVVDTWGVRAALWALLLQPIGLLLVLGGTRWRAAATKC